MIKKTKNIIFFQICVGIFIHGCKGARGKGQIPGGGVALIKSRTTALYATRLSA